MLYTVIEDGREQTYEGFVRIVIPTFENILVVVFIEDYQELWYIDPKNKELELSELKRYYRSLGFDNAPMQIWNLCDHPTTTEL